MTRPQISEELHQINNFSSLVQDNLLNETPVSAIEVFCEQMQDMDFGKLDMRASVLKNCAFRHCCFIKTSFVDVVFQSCDFSNCQFTDAYFERCQFLSCKCIGVDMSHTIIKQTAVEQSNFQYASFDKAKMSDVLFDHTDLTEVSISEAKLKMFAARGSKFVKNNFSKTILASIDFTDNEFSIPTVSTPPVELKGAIVNMFQAADLIGSDIIEFRYKPLCKIFLAFAFHHEISGKKTTHERNDNK